MPRYLFIGTYSPQGSKALLAAGGTARRAAIETMVSNLGGRVESFEPGSQALGSLLPPDRAVGNYTKVVQRVPVKITIDDAGALAGRLLPGLSVEVSVDTAVADP